MNELLTNANDSWHEVIIKCYQSLSKIVILYLSTVHLNTDLLHKKKIK